jgi:hypothetical protein
MLMTGDGIEPSPSGSVASTHIVNPGIKVGILLYAGELLGKGVPVLGAI